MKKITIPIYNSIVFLYIEETYDRIIKHAHDNYNITNLKMPTGICDGRMVDTFQGDFYLWIKSIDNPLSSADFAVVLHESGHIAHGILKWIGAQEPDEEIVLYLQGCIFEKIVAECIKINRRKDSKKQKRKGRVITVEIDKKNLFNMKKMLDENREKIDKAFKKAIDNALKSGPRR